jgi:hypothetical protein
MYQAIRATPVGRRRRHQRWPARGAGLDIGPSEAETFWTEFLRKLARRELRGVKLVVSDAHERLKVAITPRSCMPSGSAAGST